MKRLMIVLCIFVGGINAQNLEKGIEQTQKVYKIAIRAYAGKEEAIRRWSPTIEYLEQKLPGTKFEIIPFINFDKTQKMIEKEEIDFLLSDPLFYAQMEALESASRVATLTLKHKDTYLSEFGGVIFTHADSSIKTVEHMRGKTFLAVSPRGFAGYLVGVKELRDLGIDHTKFFKKIEFANGIGKDVVLAIKQKKADVGIVRTGLIENMAKKGVVELSDFKVIHPLKSEDFPLMRSTKLYPEFALSKMNHISSNEATNLLKALLQISERDEPAIKGRYAHWAAPQQYGDVTKLIKSLKIYPFDQKGEVTLVKIWQKYKIYLLIAAALLALFILYNLKITQKSRFINALINNIGEGIYGIDKRGYCIWINDNALKMLGFTKEEVIGNNQHRLFHHTRVDGSRYQEKDCPIYKTLHDRKRRVVDEWFITKEGKTFPVSLVVAPAYDEGVIITFQDQSKDRVRFERDLFIGGPSMLFIWKAQKGCPVEYVSPNVVNILGYTKAELEKEGFCFITLLHKDDAQKIAAEVENNIAKQLSFWEHTYRLKKANGEYRWFYDYTIPTYNKEGKLIAIKGYLIDITKQQEIQQQLQQTTKQLESLNTHLQEEVDKKVEELTQKDKMLQTQSKLASMGEMISAIAHQWRQPLNALSINIQNLDDDYEEGLIDEEFIHQFIDKQTQTIYFMSKTIDDFRNFFKSDKDKTTFSIGSIIDHITQLINAQLKSHNIKLTVEGEDFSVEGYEGEMKQVFLNLISNAKDAIIQQGSTGKIKIILDKEHKKVYFQDSGGGVKEDILEKLFEPYFTTKEEGKGTGIGLYMSRTIIMHHMDGNITAYNKDSGLCVEITL